MEPVRRFLLMPQVTNVPTGDIHSTNFVAVVGFAVKGNLALVKDNKSRIRAVNGS